MGSILASESPDPEGAGTTRENVSPAADLISGVLDASNALMVAVPIQNKLNILVFFSLYQTIIFHYYY